jgi:Rrf2 family protein
MFLTTRGRYATRAMIYLAMHHGEPPIPVAAIAAQEELSEKYLQQLLGTLRRAGLVRVVMGPHGGFELARPPAQVTIGAILRAVEGDIALAECVAMQGVCAKTTDCRARRVWCAATKALVEFLDAQTLATAMREGPCGTGKEGSSAPRKAAGRSRLRVGNNGGARD